MAGENNEDDTRPFLLKLPWIDVLFCQVFSRLKSLSVACIYGITDKSLVVMAHTLKCLESLNVSGCWRITDYGMSLVGEYCRALKSLKVEDCRGVTEYSLMTLRFEYVLIESRKIIVWVLYENYNYKFS
ncbi:hypothetical protein CEXT_442701 [Caerostris extrusa]|uniref:Uncharacterized protein n=1 Tax=Caerostris extrusa TaxID=172846 RepID=A0AAV4PC90_CAEEX|nr:hypothetical protein CEXT_442701 [Caerostris extrusa]